MIVVWLILRLLDVGIVIEFGLGEVYFNVIFFCNCFIFYDKIFLKEIVVG